MLTLKAKQSSLVLYLLRVCNLALKWRKIKRTFLWIEHLENIGFQRGGDVITSPRTSVWVLLWCGTWFESRCRWPGLLGLVPAILGPRITWQKSHIPLYTQGHAMAIGTKKQRLRQSSRAREDLKTDKSFHVIVWSRLCSRSFVSTLILTTSYITSLGSY